MSPKPHERPSAVPRLRRAQELILHFARVWDVSSPKELARRLIAARKNRFAGFDGLIPDEEEREEFEGLIRSKMSLQDEGEGALAALIGRTFRYQRRHDQDDLARPSLELREAHRAELAKLFLNPEPLLVSRLDDLHDAIRHALQHVSAYPLLLSTKNEFNLASSEVQRLEGRAPVTGVFFHAWGGGTRPIDGEAGTLVRAKAREVLHRIRERLPRVGPASAIDTGDAAMDAIELYVWERLKAMTPQPADLGGTRPAANAAAEPASLEGVETDPGPSRSRQIVGEAGLESVFRELTQDRELSEMVLAVRRAEGRADTSRARFLAEARRLGQRLEGGEPLRGRCEIGY